MICQFIAKADIAIRTPAQVEAIDPDVAVGHDAIEVDEDLTAGVVCGQREMFAIPAYARRQKTTRASRWILLVEWPFNTPVMRHIELPPCAVIEVWFLSVGSIALKKTPIAVERRSNSTIARELGGHRRCNREQGHDQRRR